MSTPYRVGVIGCGGMSRNHMRGYIDSGRYEIVALADLSEAAMQEVNTQFNISPTHYTDAHKMLAAETLDVISVCTWHGGHAPWTIAAAAAKPKAILCEKPMADTRGRGRADDDRLSAQWRKTGDCPSAPLSACLYAGERSDCRRRNWHVNLIQSFGGDGSAQLQLAPDRHVPLSPERRRVRVGDGQH